MAKFNEEDACDLEGKRLILFLATDLTAGELFRTELSECESRREAGMGAGWVGETITGLDCTIYPGAPSSFMPDHLVLTKCTGWLSLLLSSTLLPQSCQLL